MMSNAATELHRIVYTSTATQPFSIDELRALVLAGRANNVRDGVSGLLLYHEGCFMQVLEGPRSAVEATWARIRGNRRHQGFIELVNEPVGERLFTEAGMYRADTRVLGDDELEAAGPLLRDADWLDRVRDPDTAMILLRTFRRQLGPGEWRG